jgi:hypothetical protein
VINSITRDPQTNNDGLKVDKATDFTFNFSISHSLTTPAKFIITLPEKKDIKLISNPPNTFCKAMNGATELANPVLTCTIDAIKREITVGGYCTDGVACNVARRNLSDELRYLAATKTISIKFKKDFVKNMGWVGGPATDSFTIKSTTADGIYFVDGATTIINAVPNLIEDVLTLPKDEISRSSNLVNAQVTWIMYIKLNSNTLSQTGKMAIDIPADTIYDMGDNIGAKDTETST